MTSNKSATNDHFTSGVLISKIKNLRQFYGCYDKHLKLLENAFDISIAAQGRNLKLTGKKQDVLLASRIIKNLEQMDYEGFRVSDDEFRVAIRNAQHNISDESMRDLLLSGSILTTKTKKIYPKTPNQKRYVNTIQNTDLVFAIGPAGTGKTYLAVAVAVTYLLAKKVSRIVLVRPAVEAGESLGFLPGDMYQKVNPYLRPLYDALYEMLDVDRANRMIERRVIEIAPIAFMRGRTLNDSFIIMDEGQNLTPEQMKMFLTRLGFKTKTVVTGDITQIDIASEKSGLVQVQSILQNVPSVEFVYFERKDVVRCPLVQEIVRAYEQSEKTNTK